MRSLASFLLGCVVVSGSALAGCNLQQSYVEPNGQPVIQLAMPANTPPLATSRESVLYAVEENVYFPVRNPTMSERQALGAMHAPPPFARMPWVQRYDYEIEISLVITNVDTMTVTTTATINGINQFNWYLPGYSINDNAIVPDFSQWEHTWSLAPGQRQTVTVREEELDEVAADLASVVNTGVTFGMTTGMTPMPITCSDIANEIVYFANQSNIDPRSHMCVPSVVPGLVGIVLGLRAEGDPGSTAPAVAIEATIRLRDINNRLTFTETPMNVMIPHLGQTPFTPPMTVM
jgi:hypothetical protein